MLHSTKLIPTKVFFRLKEKGSYTCPPKNQLFLHLLEKIDFLSKRKNYYSFLRNRFFTLKEKKIVNTFPKTFFMLV